MTPEIHTAIAHYLDIDLRWRLIVKLINRQYGTEYTSKQLQELYAQK